MKKDFKCIVIFLAAFFIRLIPFRAPNLEPIMTSLMPISKTYSKYMVFTFGFLSIFIFDLVTSGIGIWTIVTALAYGFLGLGASIYFKNRNGRLNYIKYAIIGTIFYDAVTGLTIGPLFFNQSFIVSLIGQIPFTLIHLIGNVSFAIVVSPILEKWLAKERKEFLVNSSVLVS